MDEATLFIHMQSTSVVEAYLGPIFKFLGPKILGPNKKLGLMIFYRV